MAQLVARLVRIEEVRGSNPLRSTDKEKTPEHSSGVFFCLRVIQARFAR